MVTCLGNCFRGCGRVVDAVSGRQGKLQSMAETGLGFLWLGDVGFEAVLWR